MGHSPPFGIFAYLTNEALYYLQSAEPSLSFVTLLIFTCTAPVFSEFLLVLIKSNEICFDLMYGKLKILV